MTPTQENAMQDDPWAEYGPAREAEPMRRPTIAELEAILNGECEYGITILPNGEIRAIDKSDMPKPLTMRENLGGEYACA